MRSISRQMLVNVIGTDEQAFHDFSLGADREHLAARIYEFVRIVRQQIEIQSVSARTAPYKSRARPARIVMSRAGSCDGGSVRGSTVDRNARPVKQVGKPV